MKKKLLLQYRLLIIIISMMINKYDHQLNHSQYIINKYQLQLQLVNFYQQPLQQQQFEIHNKPSIHIHIHTHTMSLQEIQHKYNTLLAQYNQYRQTHQTQQQAQLQEFQRYKAHIDKTYKQIQKKYQLKLQEQRISYQKKVKKMQAIHKQKQDDLAHIIESKDKFIEQLKKKINQIQVEKYQIIENNTRMLYDLSEGIDHSQQILGPNKSSYQDLARLYQFVLEENNSLKKQLFRVELKGKQTKQNKEQNLHNTHTNNRQISEQQSRPQKQPPKDDKKKKKNTTNNSFQNSKLHYQSIKTKNPLNSGKNSPRRCEHIRSHPQGHSIKFDNTIFICNYINVNIISYSAHSHNKDSCMRKYLTGRATNRNIQILVAVILLLVSIANIYSTVTYAVQAHNRGQQQSKEGQNRDSSGTDMFKNMSKDKGNGQAQAQHVGRQKQKQSVQGNGYKSKVKELVIQQQQQQHQQSQPAYTSQDQPIADQDMNNQSLAQQQPQPQQQYQQQSVLSANKNTQQHQLQLQQLQNLLPKSYLTSQYLKSKRQHQNKNKLAQPQLQVQQIQEILTQTLSQSQQLHNIQQRVHMGQPTQHNSFQKPKLRIWVIQGEHRSYTCAIMNAITLLTNSSISSITQLLSPSLPSPQLKLSNFIVLTDRSDSFASQLLLKNFRGKNIASYNVPLDADYKFIHYILGNRNCRKLVYLQHNFNFNCSHHATDGLSVLSSYIQKLDNFQVYYSSHIYTNNSNENQSTKLPDLSNTDLSKLTPQQYNKYIFIFTYKYLHIMGPFKFGYYRRFTIQEMLILPILAVGQMFGLLREIKFGGCCQVVGGVKAKFFQLEQDTNSGSSNESLCFVSYPTYPDKYNLLELYKYMESLSNLNFTNVSISVVIYLPYSFTSDTPTNTNGKHILQKLLQFHTLPHQTIKLTKLILQHNKAVSSLSNYQSSYIYCPYNSTLISSRHNIQFKPRFVQSLLFVFKEQAQYYIGMVDYQGQGHDRENKNGIQQLMQTLRVNNVSRNKLRQFLHILQPIQIYKPNTLKSDIFWSLKSSQTAFYQSQFSYIANILQKIEYDNIQLINESIITVYARNTTASELDQIQSIVQYGMKKQSRPGILQKLSNYSIHNFENGYNCLLNQAYSRHTSPIIPKIIHISHITLSKQSDQFTKSLTSQLQLSNPQFQILHWKLQNLTHLQFPLTYSFIMKTLHYSTQVQSKTEQYACISLINALVKYQSLYNYGGVYIDYGVEVRRSLSDYLRYQIFFAGMHLGESSLSIQNQIMGAIQHSYYIRVLLNQIISQANLDYSIPDPLYYKCNYFLARIFNSQQLFTVVGFGFHLLHMQIQPQHELCNGQGPSQTQRQSQTEDCIIQLPTKYYPESYAVTHKYFDNLLF